MSTPLDTDHISRIEAALKDEPTLSQWEVLGDSRYIYSNDLVNDGEEEWRPLIATIDDDERLIDFEANARFIAACNPVAIRALLAERDALKADAERYRWLRGGKEIPAHSVRWARWDVRQWCGSYWSAMFAEQMDAAIDAERGIT